MKCKLPILLILLIFTIFILSACGNAKHSADNINPQTDFSTTETFVISTPFTNLPRLQGPANTLQQILNAQESHTQINLIHYMQNEWYDHQNLLLSQFAAGLGPDIFVRNNFLLHPFIENGFLADIYTIIDQSANFTREDFFTNVLKGIEIDEKLYMLPIDFGIDFIGINANVPPSFIDRFTALNHATPADISILYLDLIAQYPEWAEFAFIHGLDAAEIFLPEFNYAIDFNNRTANFTTVQNTLENILPAFARNERFDTPPFTWIRSLENIALKQDRYVFSRVYERTAGIYGLFEFHEPFFINYIPLANESGQLITRNWSLEFAVSSIADPNLAMEFMAQVITQNATNPLHPGADIPILRHYFENLEMGFNRLLLHMELPSMVNSQDTATQQAMSRLQEYSNQPFTYLYSDFLIPTDLKILNSNIPIHEIINQMNASTLAWFNAYRPEIEKYVPWELQPRHTLTIRARCVDVRIIQQAAAAMQAEWQERGKEYNFHAEIDYYDWHDWQGRDARISRFQMEFMTGQAPDMFMFDPFEQNIHTLAASGFLQDINSIIASDPNTNRDAFFTQALDAFEINNRLYVFPTSLGMSYIGINADLPEEFINRFAQKSSITLIEMMEFYLDLMDTHDYEFGHLIYTGGDGLTQFENQLQAMMGEFIDFSTNTVDLTDPRFIQALELMGEIQNRRNPIKIECSSWSQSWWYTPEGHDFFESGERGRWCMCANPCTPWWRGFTRRQQMIYMLDSYVFYTKSENLSHYKAFFTQATPRFTHHIPLADGQGRLLIDTPGAFRQTWSGICITTGADTALAWEFAQHLIYAYANPNTGGAQSIRSDWGYQSIASPILRSTYRDSIFRNLDNANWEWYRRWFVSGPPTPGATSANPADVVLPSFENFGIRRYREAQFESAIDRIAAYNEQPMGMLWPMIPTHLVEEHLDLFLRGLISAENAAHRMQNAVFLWMIE